MGKDLLENINYHMKHLSKGQKKIAEFLLEHYDKAVSLTASRLGKMIGVSESTVVRFAVELGYSGYPELQKALVDAGKNRLTATQRIGVSSDMMDKSAGDILDVVLKNDAEKLMTTLNDIDREAFSNAVESIINARRVYIVAGRSSGALSAYFYFYLKMMHDNVVLVDSASVGEVYEHMLNISENDACIAISFPRYTWRTFKAIEYAGSQNATTIAITDNYDSPIGNVGKYVICAKTDAISFIDSITAPLSVICAVLSAISLRKKNSLFDAFERLEKLWKENQVY